MIPKTIHYCWFGGKEIPANLRAYMDSWHDKMPGWEVRAWTEENFSIASAPLYVRQAYEAKKFAFVSDYVRLWALEQYGGVYFDTDVEVIRSFEELSEFRNELAENKANIPTGKNKEKNVGGPTPQEKNICLDSYPDGTTDSACYSHTSSELESVSINHNPEDESSQLSNQIQNCSVPEVLCSRSNLSRGAQTREQKPTALFMHKIAQSPLIEHKMSFIGFEESKAKTLGTNVIGCEPHCAWVREMLDYYDKTPFIREDGSMDMTANSELIARLMEKHGLVRNGKKQVVRIKEEGNRTEEVHIYDYHYFSPITSTRVMRKNRNTFSIHHFAGSWVPGAKNHWYNHPVWREVSNAVIQVKRFVLGRGKG